MELVKSRLKLDFFMILKKVLHLRTFCEGEIRMSKKQILQGIDNFKKLIDNNGYYVDKTFMIKDLIDTPNQVVLITRPRRFGKTLNMSMLKYFFEHKKCREYDMEDVDTGYLFEDLHIFNNGQKYIDEQGKYPVIYLTFKSAKQKSWEDTFYHIKQLVSEEYKRHKYLLDSNILSSVEKDNYKKIIDLQADPIRYTDVIINLSLYLSKYFKNPCYVIIDEYDTPIQAGYIYGYFNEIVEFSKSMLVKGFKDNKGLKQGVLTGIMKVAQESIFSDFNNPLVCTLLSEEYAESFGFTKNEVAQMAKYVGHQDKLDDIKKWYDGYIFGNETLIYNPWSIIKYLYNPNNGLKPYWINTSDNQIIKEVLQLDKVEGKEVAERLIKGEEVAKTLEENIIYQNIKTNPNVAWSFLLHAGYLKAYEKFKEEGEDKFMYKLAIPNTEVKIIYKDMILKYFDEDEKISDSVMQLVDNLLKGNIEIFELILKEIYLKQISYNDVASLNKFDEIAITQQNNRYENFHHGFMLGMFMLISHKYVVESNREYGKGRPDLVIYPKDNTKTAYIFEFKWDSTKGPHTVEALVEKATTQIKEQQYKKGLSAKHGHKEVICMGVGFKAKEVKIRRV